MAFPPAQLVDVNGIRLSVAVDGAGPTVVLVHGFPELGYSWRLQVPALVAAGYRVVVPDMRGFGGSDRPEAVEAYDMVALTGDLVGLLDWLEVEDAVFVGHDWGAAIVWGLARLHPGRVRAVAGMSVPPTRRAPALPMAILRSQLGDDFYMAWFQKPGVADEALARDVRRTLTSKTAWTPEWAADPGAGEEPARPPWLTENDLAVYVDAFERTGFTGGLNYYRNIDRNWELSDAADDVIAAPALYLTGGRDPVRRFMPSDRVGELLTDLRANVVIDGAGHWVQQERPAEVNAALLAFLAGLD